MVEGENKEIPNTEQGPKNEAQDVGEEKETSFEKKIEDLINPPGGKEKVIKDDNLRRLATAATKPWNQTPENMNELLKKGNDWYLDSSKKIPEEEWGILAGLIYRGKSQLEAEQLKKTSSTVSSQGPAIDLDPLVNKISGGQEDLLNALKSQQITLEQFLNLSQKQTQNLSESLKRVSIKEERDRWVDVEYRQEFYTRFTPSLEPRFYTELSEEERRLFDSRWQLARAAFYKKAYLAFPEKLAENQDLILLGMEHMERLYNIPGVKEALEWYADVIVNKREVDKLDEKTKKTKKINIFQCGNEIDFEKFRGKMREEVLKEIERKDKNGKLIKIKLEKIQRKEADVVAWNWIFCSNLVESVDSRYSYSGERHKGLPGVLCSDDVRAVLHPQEKFEDKSSKGQDWGAFGKWGSLQMKRIKDVTNFNKNNDEIKFLPASNLKDFWAARRTKQSKFRNGVLERGEIEIRVPECYPTTTLRSFWEGESVDDEEFKKKFGLDRKPNLLDFLLSKEEIKWKEIGSGFWVDYLPIKLRRAVKLLEYFKGQEIRMEVGKFGSVKNWADPLLEIFVRLGLSEKSYGGEKRLAGKRFHNLKFWAVHAATGGEGNIESKTPVINLSFETRLIVRRALKDRNVKYLGKDENLGIMDII